MLRYLCLVFCLVVAVGISYDVPIAETEKADLLQEVQDMKEQVKALSDANERLSLQIKDLYFMTEPLRILVVDEDEGSYYHARRRVDTHGNKMWGMLPSQLPHADLYFEIRSADGLGYSKEKIKGLSDKLMQMPINPYLNPYKPKYNFFESSLTRDHHHPNLNTYFLSVPFLK